MHVSLLGHLGFWEVPVHIVYGDKFPGEVVTVPDALEPRFFGGKSRGRMEVSDCTRQSGEIVSVVDGLP